MKFCIGPVTKNTIDVVIKYSLDYGTEFIFIPSRRQIEMNGGYVENLTTKQFYDYVKSKNNKIQIERDHGGPGQGKIDDDGFDSLKEDSKYFDIIHIDPWKKYPAFDDAVEWTIKLIKYCYSLNQNIIYEIGTEEGIRPIESDELDNFVNKVKNGLESEVFSRIKYLVIQCGTKLLEQTNIGVYNEDKLKDMLEVCKKHNLTAKEHNGDWITYDIVKKKEKQGLECINIAPEFGEIETLVYLKYFKEYNLLDEFYDICFKSNKWKKWVSSSFIPENNKEKLILICGHYTFSYPSFLKLKEILIKNSNINIDNLISDAIIEKLNNLYGLFKNKVLITTSGIGKRLGNITNFFNKSLIRLGNKLAICYIIEKFDKKKTDFIITLGYQGHLVKEFLELAYENYNFTFITIDNFEKNGSSLVYSLLKTEKYLKCPFYFFCCDSIIIDDILLINENKKNNYLFIAKSKETSFYSSVNICNDEIIKINSKGEKNVDYVYTGISYIYDYNEYWKEMNILYNENSYNKNLSDIDVIRLLINKKINIYYKILNEWYDTGNITSLNIAINKFKCDYNILHKDYETICFMEDKVIKFINNKDYNLNKIKRGKKLYPITPRIINEGKYSFAMEKINGTILSEIKNYGEIYKLLNWSYKNLWINKQINDEFINTCHNFYKIKTYERLNELKKFNLIDYEIINGIFVGKIDDILAKIDWNSLNTNEFYQYHGDFILDNIIYYNDNYKLIDWRQDFGGNINHGDMYYDLAKLRHNIIFNHNNVNNNLFEVIVLNNTEITIDIKCNYLLIKQLEDFDKFVLEKNLNLNKIKILTSLIWLNMSPLHEYNISQFLFYFSKFNLAIL
jgi:NDP-sugar pyrophosphorylase family protein